MVVFGDTTFKARQVPFPAGEYREQFGTFFLGIHLTPTFGRGLPSMLPTANIFCIRR